MALLFTSWWSELYFTIFFSIFVYYLYFKFFSSKYWKDKGVPHLPPVFILGNASKASFTKNFAFILSDLYRTHKEKKLLGFWNFISPALLITDVEIIKNVLTRDFNHFRDRLGVSDFDQDPLANHLFNVGGVKWRNLRVKLTPTFTSGKMKMMFPTMIKCGEELQNFMEGMAESGKVVEVKEVLSRFTTDIISSCAFGIQTNSLKNPDSEFRKYGKKVFDVSLVNVFRGIIFNVSPNLFKILRISLTPKDVSDFFLNVIRETIEYREKNQIKRNDFMDLLIQLKNKGHIEDVDGVIPVSPDGDDNSTEDLKFTFNVAAAQAFVFFAAGFETSSTTLTFALYELALNPDVQELLHNEVDQVLKKYDGKLTYEGVMEMEYLDWVVQDSTYMASPGHFLRKNVPDHGVSDRPVSLKIRRLSKTLRKHPPVPFLFRLCNKDYEIPELNVKIPKKTPVMIPIFGIQRDPEFFPAPEKFDPKRYSPEEKAKRHPFTSLPFGEGPRNCIGSRFGLMQTKVGLVSLLSKFKVELTNETPIPLKYHKRSFVLAPTSSMPLKFKKRMRGQGF